MLKAPTGYWNFRQIADKANEALGDTFEGKPFSDVQIANNGDFVNLQSIKDGYDDSNRLSLSITIAEKWISKLVEWKLAGSRGPTPRPEGVE